MYTLSFIQSFRDPIYTIETRVTTHIFSIDLLKLAGEKTDDRLCYKIKYGECLH
jgi:hypothetical protein